VNQISIFSDNKAMINLWSTALSSLCQVHIIYDINVDLRVDIVIIDTQKIDTNDSLLSIFSKKSIKFLAVGTDWPEDKQIMALVHGAAGYCSESDPPELLLQAVKSILNGEIWIQRHLIPKVITALTRIKPMSGDPDTEKQFSNSSKLLQTLSERELDVAKMIRLGENNKNIASTLHITERTVKAHLTSIYRKLNVSDRLRLALFIKEFG